MTDEPKDEPLLDPIEQAHTQPTDEPEQTVENIDLSAIPVPKELETELPMAKTKDAPEKKPTENKDKGPSVPTKKEPATTPKKNNNAIIMALVGLALALLFAYLLAQRKKRAAQNAMNNPQPQGPDAGYDEGDEYDDYEDQQDTGDGPRVPAGSVKHLFDSGNPFHNPDFKQ